jgi:hypothetical protein
MAAIPSINSKAKASADGDNTLSQTSWFGDYNVQPPSWVKQTGFSDQMIYAGIFVAGIVGVMVWKSKSKK